jgi:DNA-binding CsgD family transcriptional regulator
MSTREIAEELKISFKTIETHRENMKRKLGLRGAAALVHYATEWAHEYVSMPSNVVDETSNQINPN